MPQKTSLLSRIRNAWQSASGGERITTPEQLERVLRAGNVTASGAAVSANNALTVGAVYACMRILADSVGMCPLVLYEIGRNGRKTEATRHPLHSLLKVRPNAWQTPFDFQRMLMMHLLGYGSAYVFKSKAAGRLLDLIPLDPARMSVEVANETTWRYIYTRIDGTREVYLPPEIMHLRGLSWQNWLGISTISTAAREDIGLAMAARKQAAMVFSQGAQLSGYLKTDKTLTKEAMERLVAAWADKYAGVDNAWRTPVLEEGLDFVKISMTGVEAQLLESRKLGASDIAMAFGVPPHMIGQVDKATSWGSGIEQQSIGFVTYTVMPWLTNIVQHVHLDCLRDDEWSQYVVDPNTAALTKGDAKSQAEALQIKRQNGVINADEWRAEIGLNEREDGGGKQYWQPSNMMDDMRDQREPQQSPQQEAQNAPANLRIATQRA